MNNIDFILTGFYAIGSVPLGYLLLRLSFKEFNKMEKPLKLGWAVLIGLIFTGISFGISLLIENYGLIQQNSFLFSTTILFYTLIGFSLIKKIINKTIKTKPKKEQQLPKSKLLQIIGKKVEQFKLKREEKKQIIQEKKKQKQFEEKLRQQASLKNDATENMLVDKRDELRKAIEERKKKTREMLKKQKQAKKEKKIELNEASIELEEASKEIEIPTMEKTNEEEKAEILNELKKELGEINKKEPSETKKKKNDLDSLIEQLEKTTGEK